MLSSDWIEIDGSRGEGGGQIVRSSLTLAALTGKPLRVSHVRAGRTKPGLLRQHLAALRAAATVCAAEVEGGELGASEFTFRPSTPVGGQYEFGIGSAGSTSLLAQTVIPILMMADTPSTLQLSGGTHNPWAPTFDFLQQVYLPQLAKMGPRVDAELQRYGFYPAGGGQVRFSIQPSSRIKGLHLNTRDQLATYHIRAVVAHVDKSVGEREINVIRRKTNWKENYEVVVDRTSPGPGNILTLSAAFGNVCEMVTAIGKPGLKAELVARRALKAMRTYLASDAPVGEYLADQLLLPMGLAAARGAVSSFRTCGWSQHSQTHCELLRTFLPIEVKVTQEDNGSNCSVEVRPQ